MNKPKISKETKALLFELGIEILKTLKELNQRESLKLLPQKSKVKKGVKNVHTTEII